MMFSFVIPVYNVAPYLRECLDSVLAAARTLNEKCEVRSEKCGAVEIICVDDGSTDGSGEILDEWEKKIGGENRGTVDGLSSDRCAREGARTTGVVRFRVIHQSNAGVSAARNRALDVATGDWILFLDADDVVNSEVLVEIARVANRHDDADLISFESRDFAVDEKLRWPVADVAADEKVIDVSSEFVNRLFDKGFWSFAYKAKIVRNLKFPSYAIGEDNVFKVLAQLKAATLVEVSRELHGYRIRPGSANLSGTTYSRLLDMINWRRDLLNLLSKSQKTYDPAFVQKWLFDIALLWQRLRFGRMNKWEIVAAWLHRQSTLLSLAFKPRLPITTRLGCAICFMLPFPFAETFTVRCCNKLLKVMTERGC